MKRSFGPRKTSANLSESIQQHLNMYAIAASAAGVSVLTSTQPAQAKIIYTPVHQVIKSGQPYDLDLNRDGITDFTIKNFKGTTQFNIALYEIPGPGNRVVGHTSFVGTGNLWCASALKRSAGIGPRRKFTEGTKGWLLYSGASNNFCLDVGWKNNSNRYLGLSFKIRGKTHYGWARLSVLSVQVPTSDLVYSVTLKGYAYETIPSKAIKAGQTKGAAGEPEDFRHGASTAPIPHKLPSATLGTLALGAQCVPLLWRKETQEVIGQ